MKKCSLFSLLFLALSLNIVAEVGHGFQGTDYAADGVDAYAKFRHGSDGALFLDPYFLPLFDHVKGQIVLDAGCGAGPWSLYAAQQGATVHAIDIQTDMVNRAKKAANKKGVADAIEFRVGSVSDLPYVDNSFDVILSVNVFCNLQNDVFIAQFKEFFRTLKSGGKLVITAPASFDTIFTCNDSHKVVRNIISNVLSALEGDNNSQSITQNLNTLKNVLRATFTVRDKKLILIEDEKELNEGQVIWRKIPGLTVPNFYHSEKSYIQALLDAGLSIERIDRPRFVSAQEWQERGLNLGKEYMHFHPFVILHATKP